MPLEPEFKPRPLSSGQMLLQIAIKAPELEERTQYFITYYAESMLMLLNIVKWMAGLYLTWKLVHNWNGVICCQDLRKSLAVSDFECPVCYFLLV